MSNFVEDVIPHKKISFTADLVHIPIRKVNNSNFTGVALLIYEMENYKRDP